MKKNSIFTIIPHKLDGQWVFDDESTELYKEAFVAGADDLLEILSDGKDSVVMLFSEEPFPEYTVRIEYIGPELGGSNYFCEEYNHKLWLCSALFKYFEEAPKAIYIKIKPVKIKNYYS